MRTATARAMTNLDVETPHDSLANDVLLILRLRLIVDGRSAALALLRQGNANLFVDVVRNRTIDLLSILRTALAAGALRFLLPFSSRKWGCLPLQPTQLILPVLCESVRFPLPAF